MLEQREPPKERTAPVRSGVGFHLNLLSGFAVTFYWNLCNKDVAMVRLCGAALGLLAFGVTVLLGLAAGNPTEVTLLRAVWAMLAFCVLGLFVGWVAYRVLDEHALSKHRELFEDAPEEEPGQNESGNDGVTGAASGE